MDTGGVRKTGRGGGTGAGLPTRRCRANVSRDTKNPTCCGTGKKIAGAAQRRNRNGLLIQGSVQPPPVKIVRAEWEEAMCETAQANDGVTWAEFAPDDALRQSAAELAANTYSQSGYNCRR